MGATFLGDRVSGLIGNEDRAIADFIEMVKASPNSRIVVTTREHIFGQAIAASERLRQAGLDGHKVLLRVGDYGLGQRAQILYNHLYFSDLPDPYKDALLEGSFYREIVRHPKFNPRLIEWLSSYNRIQFVHVANYQAFVRDLLRDPSEVWMHAYEQQLSDAGRSLLLALYSLGGRAEGAVLRSAFNSLHQTRASRWGIVRRPEDWASAIAELANAFIRPAGKSGFEVLDPSVIDLMNAVLRKAPENAVDIVLGSIDFIQIGRIWEIAQREMAGVKAALAEGGPPLAEAIKARLSQYNRMVNFSDGAGEMPWTAEARLASLVPMADALKSTALLDVVSHFSAALEVEWLLRDVRINDGAEALRALNGVSWKPLENPGLVQDLTERLIARARLGCRVDELRELVGALDLDGPENEFALASLRVAFEMTRPMIETEIRECSKGDEFNGLEEDLELFALALGVDVTQEKARLEDAMAEYNDYEENRADQMMDRYKDEYRGASSSDDGMADLFDSLRSDRG